MPLKTSMIRRHILPLVSIAALTASCKKAPDLPASSVACASAGSSSGCDGSGTPLLGTKSLYWVQQDPATYEKPPAGYEPIYAQVVSRHSSRGLSAPSSDMALYNLVKKAKEDNAATSLGQSLGDDMLELIKINAFLGEGVDGMSKTGYGNLSKQGIEEHGLLGKRLYERQGALFEQIASSAGTDQKREIIISFSGVQRTVDSAHFFQASLIKANPALEALMKKSAPTPVPPGSGNQAEPGVDHFALHFHDLNETDDLVPSADHPYAAIMADSQKYQAYQKGKDFDDKVNSIRSDTKYSDAARAVLENLFDKSFVAKIEDGTYKIDNSGQVTVTSDAGKTKVVELGPQKKPKPIQDLTDAAEKIFDVYAIAAPLHYELNEKDYSRYLTEDQAKLFSALQDAEDFYDLGPGMTELAPVTYKMAQGLLDDMFTEVDAIAKGDLSHGAKLRFAHAETIVPLVSILGLKDYATPLPRSESYSYTNNSWRGRLVAPLTGNVQWDVYRNASGTLIVRMLHNEKEVDFKSDCDDAKVAAGSRYYDYQKLKDCYAAGSSGPSSAATPSSTSTSTSASTSTPSSNAQPSDGKDGKDGKDDQDGNDPSQQAGQSEQCKEYNRDGDTCEAIDAKEGDVTCQWGQKWVCENGCAKWLADTCAGNG
jgi:hypothetical protein